MEQEITDKQAQKAKIFKKSFRVLDLGLCGDHFSWGLFILSLSLLLYLKCGKG